ncbi:MAG: FAD-binding oxidoreductase [Pseudomonadota bacterium]
MDKTLATPDVTILGAGVIGLSCALACLKQGAKVQVIDPFGPAHGASGGIVGALAPHTPDNWNPKKQFQFESLLMARDFWPWVEDISGQTTGYRPTGRIQPILTEKQRPAAHRRAIESQVLWQGQAEWVVVPASHHDWEPPTPTGWLITDTLSAHLHPLQATQAMAQAVRALGGWFGDTPHGAVIDATGWAGLKTLSNDMGHNVGGGVKGQAALLHAPWAGKAQIFADGVHIIPHQDGTVAVGSTSERDFKMPTNTDGQLDEVITRAKMLLPVLQNARVIQRWANVRPRANSRAPMMGPHPLKCDVYIANGGFKIGFGMAPKMGKVMADLVLNGQNNIAAAFRIEKSM